MGQKKLLRAIALISALFGIGILLYVLSPILAYDLFSEKDLRTFLSPIPEDTIVQNVDYTKASNWFVGTSEEEFSKSNVLFYTISIPKLRIKKASVMIGGEDLSKSLIQYPGTASPGKSGNAVVFGHSILPQFYDPSDYLSVFSTLPTLKTGDEILVEYDGISYKYRVEDKFEVLPTDIQILEQNPSDSFLTLVTCVPPGHPGRPRRLIVRARVVPFNE